MSDLSCLWDCPFYNDSPPTGGMTALEPIVSRTTSLRLSGMSSISENNQTPHDLQEARLALHIMRVGHALEESGSDVVCAHRILPSLNKHVRRKEFPRLPTKMI
jgi:hypothetical protein